MSKKYYPVDAYYNFKDNKLFYIIKKVDNGKISKIVGSIKNPEIKFKLAPRTRKLTYLTNLDNCIDYKVSYREYYRLRSILADAYTGKKPTAKDYNKLYNTHQDIVSLKYEIYDDYKIETQFMHDKSFTFDDDYINAINVGFFDIEVHHNDTEFPHASEAKYQVNAITLYEYIDNVSVFFIYNKDHHDDKESCINAINLKLSQEYGSLYNFNINLYDNEIEMLIGFLGYIKDRIDVMVGWNSLDFDTLYIYNRCNNLDIGNHFKLSFGDIFEIMNVVDSKQGAVSTTYYTTKILSVDYIHLIKFYSMKNYPSHSLNYIAGVILKDDDVSAKVTVSNLNIEYLTNISNFIFYNVTDVLLNKRIDDKMLFIKLLFYQKKLTHGFTASSLSINNILDSYISLKTNEMGMACISPIKVMNYYTPKIWDIYKKVNKLSTKRLENIEVLREKYKGYSICVTQDDIDSISNTLTDDDVNEDTILINDKLDKLDISFLFKQDKYPGAYVKTPKKGVYTNVVDLDAESMYPTSIYTTNCSPDTWVYLIPENIALKYIYERDGLIKYLSESDFQIDIYDVLADKYHNVNCYDMIKLFDKINNNELVITEMGTIFIPAHIKVGFFRELITEPIAERRAVRKKISELEKSITDTDDRSVIQSLNINQLVLKILANSVYGFVGFRRSRVFNILIASTITINCQFLIRYVANNIERLINDR